MKKVIFMSLVAAMFAGCNNDTVPEDTTALTPILVPAGQALVIQGTDMEYLLEDGIITLTGNELNATAIVYPVVCPECPTIEPDNNATNTCPPTPKIVEAIQLCDETILVIFDDGSTDVVVSGDSSLRMVDINTDMVVCTQPADLNITD